jgi:hypothetical protein
MISSTLKNSDILKLLFQNKILMFLAVSATLLQVWRFCSPGLQFTCYSFLFYEIQERERVEPFLNGIIMQIVVNIYTHKTVSIHIYINRMKLYKEKLLVHCLLP